MSTTTYVAECPHCGKVIDKIRDSVIPTHDFPPMCRQVCRGSGAHPRREGSPLWKDKPEQQQLDFFELARDELLLYGIAVVKQMILFAGKYSGILTCPLCLGDVKFTRAKSNGHTAARCRTAKCIHYKE